MASNASTTNHRAPWNKGKIVGQKAPLDSRISGRSEFGSSWNIARENWRSSTLELTASSAAAIFSS